MRLVDCRRVDFVRTEFIVARLVFFGVYVNHAVIAVAVGNVFAVKEGIVARGIVIEVRVGNR